jgi:hypothetical protein
MHPFVGYEVCFRTMKCDYSGLFALPTVTGIGKWKMGDTILHGPRIGSATSLRTVNGDECLDWGV